MCRWCSPASIPLQVVNGSGVSPLYCFPLQVRAVVAMVKFSHLTNFVLNKKPLLYNTKLLSRWLSPIHCFIGSVASIGGRFYFLAGVNGSGVFLGEMSGNDIAMSGGSIPLQVSMVRVFHW